MNGTRSGSEKISGGYRSNLMSTHESGKGHKDGRPITTLWYTVVVPYRWVDAQPRVRTGALVVPTGHTPSEGLLCSVGNVLRRSSCDSKENEIRLKHRLPYLHKPIVNSVGSGRYMDLKSHRVQQSVCPYL